MLEEAERKKMSAQGAEQERVVEKSYPSSGPDPINSEIRIIITGSRKLGGIEGSGKSSAGNIILGKNAFDVGRRTAQCIYAAEDVHGRHVTVIETPSWQCNSPLENTSELDKLEIKCSLCLCPPGPHAILLTVPIDAAFNKSYQTAVEEHMSLLGKKVWSHTIVLFTGGDTTIEEHVENWGKHLQWLIKKCGNRYHVLNCKQHTDSTQVPKLLAKIEDMVMENNGCHYVPETDSNPLIELELKLKIAKRNKMKVSRQRNILQELLKGKQNNISDVRIVLLGAEGVGKSTSGNIILQGHFFEKTTEEVFNPLTRTTQCVIKQWQIEGCQVSVVDTPGWSTSTLENAKEIVHSLTLCSPGPHAFLLVLPACKSFTKTSQQAVEELMGLFGENAWKHTIVLFTYGHWLKDRPVEEYIACEGEALQELIEKKCDNRYCVLDSDWTNRFQVKNLLKMIEEMVARNRREYFTLENKASRPTTTMHQMLTETLEEEWKKYEDELIERMLEAAVVDLDLDEETKQSSQRIKGSFIHSIPNMSGDSLLDETSSVGADTLDPTDKVSRWLKRRHGASSGRGTMTTTSSFQDSNIESLKDDIPVLKHNPIEMKNTKYFNNMTEQKHSRSLSF